MAQNETLIQIKLNNNLELIGIHIKSTQDSIIARNVLIVERVVTEQGFYYTLKPWFIGSDFSEIDHDITISKSSIVALSKSVSESTLIQYYSTLEYLSSPDSNSDSDSSTNITSRNIH